MSLENFLRPWKMEERDIVEREKKEDDAELS